MAYKLLNQAKKEAVCASARIASGFFPRLAGLMFKKRMDNEEALVFYHAASIHTFFMRFPIDIVFLNRQMRVKRIVSYLPPWRVIFCRGAYITIELPPGKISQTGIQLNDTIKITPA